ncbi:hypothetical protein ASG52_04945 [Methylobacterium sp. Leaf456]|uniref:hypothetical protein n=1 Tax=Methylobacterium sp. Leaf456 TaxID=1736382 RepID=UPI0006F373DD|nr:hypothetical protein [Methylobacterium sp. Leaf456]KQT53466.1 hypothetical protein ASG52_04945 [Methylobacterium sp. Leaf456]
MSDTNSTKRFRRTLAALAVLAGGLIGSEAAQAAPFAALPAAALATDTAVETVQWHGHGGWGHRRHHWGHHHGWRRHHHHHHHGWGHHRRHHWGHHRHRHWGHHHGWGHRRHFY